MYLLFAVVGENVPKSNGPGCLCFWSRTGSRLKTAERTLPLHETLVIKPYIYLKFIRHLQVLNNRMRGR